MYGNTLYFSLNWVYIALEQKFVAVLVLKVLYLKNFYILQK